MIPVMRWGGPRPSPKQLAEFARENLEGVSHVESFADCLIDAWENAPPRLRTAAHELARAASATKPIFAFAEMPPAEMRDRAPEYAALLAALAAAELELFAAAAEARSEWLYMAMRRDAVAGEHLTDRPSGGKAEEK